MDVRVLKHTARYDAASKDLQAVHVEMVLNYGSSRSARPKSTGPSGSDTPASSSIRGPGDPQGQHRDPQRRRGPPEAAELIQARRQPEIVAAAAKGKGGAVLAEARRVADALRIKGEAEASYNARVAASLTPVLIQQQYLARWDGRLPQYAFGGNAVPFVQIPGASGDSGRR